METKKVYDLHEENKEMLNKLAFYKDEIGVMKNRISEIASKNTSKEVLSMVEHFQNQLIVQRNNIDELNHKVKEHESVLVQNAKDNPVAVDRRSVEDHPEMRDAFSSFEKVFNDLRHELNGFLSKTM